MPRMRAAAASRIHWLARVEVRLRSKLSIDRLLVGPLDLDDLVA
jgi:hypothetical protein